MKTESITCDICNKPAQKPGYTLQVIFHTEQTEGRGVNPYLSIEMIDLCDDCVNHIVLGNYVHANGAQGHNNFYFKKP